MLEFSGFVKSRPEVHPHIWYASFLKAQALGRPSFLSLHRPSAIQLFPSEFFPDVVLQAASRQQQDFSNIQTQLELRRTSDNYRLNCSLNKLSPSKFSNLLISTFKQVYYRAFDTWPLTFLDLKVVLDEGYNPHLTDGISTQFWAPRAPRTRTPLNVIKLQ
jgi:hypothetical protein